MTYLDLVQSLATAAAEATSDYSARTVGVWTTEVLRHVDLPMDPSLPDFHGSPVHVAALHGLQDLADLGVVRLDGQRILVSEDGRRVAADLTALWSSIFMTQMDEEQTAFLGALVECGLDAPTSLAPRDVEADAVFNRLGWKADPMKLVFLFNSLKDKNLVSGVLATGPYIHGLRPTYAGVVRATQEEPTALRELIERLLPDWETASVEFKLLLDLDRDAGKAEFAKDVCALATTKTSDRQRYLVVGFDPKTRDFARSLDARVTQDRIEHILNAHTTIAPPTRLYRGHWPGGLIGVVVIARNAEHLPYRLRSETAAKFFTGRDVFVRHGSQVEPPTPAELDDLIAEGRHARERSAS